MKASVDKDGCIGCELCVSICPAVFRMTDEGVAEAYAEVTNETSDSAAEARDSCPVSVINIEE